MRSCPGCGVVTAEDSTIHMKRYRFGNGTPVRICAFCFNSTYSQAYAYPSSASQRLCLGRVFHSAVTSRTGSRLQLQEGMWAYCFHRSRLVPQKQSNAHTIGEGVWYAQQSFRDRYRTYDDLMEHRGAIASQVFSSSTWVPFHLYNGDKDIPGWIRLHAEQRRVECLRDTGVIASAWQGLHARVPVMPEHAAMMTLLSYLWLKGP